MLISKHLKYFPGFALIVLRAFLSFMSRTVCPLSFTFYSAQFIITGLTISSSYAESSFISALLFVASPAIFLGADMAAIVSSAKLGHGQVALFGPFAWRSIYLLIAAGTSSRSRRSFWPFWPGSCFLIHLIYQVDGVVAGCLCQ